jgi:uncharacterized protein (DUF1501 family)
VPIIWYKNKSNLPPRNHKDPHAMYFIRPEMHTRRAFLRRSAQLAATGVALPTALNLVAMGEAAAFNATDYKALVCVFLYGGNDYANTVVTYDDPSYALYSTIRGASGTAGSISIAKADMAPTLLTPATALADGRQFALHPSMTGVAGLFNSGKAAVQMNVGPLVVPMTKDQYRSTNRTANPLPPKLFSHNDQQSLWQSSSPEGSTVGWGGNIGDLALSSNSNALFTCISITGNAVFLSGDQALSYQVGSGGPVRIYTVGANAYPYGFKDVGPAMVSLTTRLGRSNQLENAYNTVTKRAVESEATITAAIDATKPTRVNNSDVYPAPFDKFGSGNPLADQMRMVARLIAARDGLGGSPGGLKRQVFLVSLGGFDLHDNLMQNQPTLMKRVSDAMTAFYEATVTLGVADKVTAFTASDFGRTMKNNGDGSDHGWGSHHLIVGGAVKGQSFYGYVPPVGAGDSNSTASVDQWHVGQGRLLPTTSVDQYAATLATWFGVAPAELEGTAQNPGILPNLKNFGGTVGAISYPKNVGFMNAP